VQHELPLITLIAAGFTSAWVLGLLAQRLRLSPIVGYILAGIIIGPHTPGFVGDVHLAQQLAEVGVILLMFGVGLHFHVKELVAVKGVAIPGAIVQSLVATLFGVVAFTALGQTPRTGAVIGMALAVASTVVLMRVLMDARVLHTAAGHVAVGWLLVEDILTVVVLVLIPVLGAGATQAAGEAPPSLWASLGIAFLKLGVLVALVVVAGRRLIPWVLTQVARLRSRELFTLTLLVFSIAVAAASYYVFGASMALGAFLAGMMVAQSPASHQAASDALPLRDAFAVLFFVSVGMLFNPLSIVEHPLMILAALGIILLAKPLAALVIVAVLGHSLNTALTVAIGLAQIGEFSFILSELARQHGLMPDEGHNALIAAAIVSIALNPLLFRSLPAIERAVRARPALYRVLNARAERRAARLNLDAAREIAAAGSSRARSAIVVGYGPVGRSVDGLLRDAGLSTTIIDLNMDTISELRSMQRRGFFGDASRAEVLEQAGAARASHLIVTLPDPAERAGVVSAARALNPSLRILVRARYLSERETLEQAGATAAVFEEAEAAIALARVALADAGAGRDVIERAVRDIRTRLVLETVPDLAGRTVGTVMVPWTSVRTLRGDTSLAEARRRVAAARHTRWPVVDPATEKVVGWVDSSDLLAIADDRPDWSAIVRPVRAIDIDASILTSLLDLQLGRETLGIVVDQGRPAGLLTIEDILERSAGQMGAREAPRPDIRLHDLLSRGGAVVPLEARTPADAVRELVGALPRADLPAGADIAGRILARETEMATDVGLGVAIPHTLWPGLRAPMIAVGVSREGLTFNPSSTEPVRLVFLILTPAEQPDLHVMTLGRVARVVSDADVRRRLLEAMSGVEAIGVIAEADAAPER
jgi:CPA2 family monovalent cation:H+ antiporter-2